MSAAVPLLAPGPPRKPPASEQFNWITGHWESPPEQIPLDFGLPEDPILHSPLPPPAEVQLLATETGAQLLVSGQGLSLGKSSERLTLKFQRKNCGSLPFFRLQEIVILGEGISLSTDLIAEACRRGIRIAFLSLSSRPVALLTSPYLTATVETRRAQLASTTAPLGAELLRWLVAGKLHNQEKLLRYFAKSRDGELRLSLESSANTLRAARKSALALPGASPDHLRSSAMGVEGAAARAYWSAIARILPASLGFRNRVHDHPEDPVNSALNYGYGILYAHVWGAVLNAGLEPFAGYLHTDRPGKPSLVLDLTEEFRQPVVDRPLFSWLTRGGVLNLSGALLDDPSREEVASRVLARLNAAEPHRGASHQLRSIIQMQARLLASAVRGLKPYRPFAFKW